MTLLSDRSIRARMNPEMTPDPVDRIVLEGFDVARDLNPCSVSVYLGDTMQVWTGPLMDPRREHGRFWQPLPTTVSEMDTPDADGSRPRIWRLERGRFYLAGLAQRLVLPRDLAGRLDGNSSEARCGIVIHQTAGHFDPGWDGWGTLEITVEAATTILWPGMRIGQFLFELLDQPCEQPYDGRYQGDRAAQPAKLPAARPVAA
jgi:deoxycytidine triphosphate deaminase